MIKIKNLTSLEAINLIENLCGKNKSGTIFLEVKPNTLAQIIIQEGQFINIKYLDKLGMAALKIIFQSKKFGLFKFLENFILMKSEQDSHLPNIDEIFALLKKARHQPNKRPNKVVKKKVQVLGDNKKKQNLTQVIEIINAELAQHIGPMASIVSQPYLESAKDLASIMSALSGLSSEIDDKTKAVEFSNAVTAKIKKLTQKDAPNEAENHTALKVENRNKQINNTQLSRVSEIITTELTLYLGPIAALVSEPYLKDIKDIASIKKSLSQLANEIDDIAKAVEFKHSVTEKIRALNEEGLSIIGY